MKSLKYYGLFVLFSALVPSSALGASWNQELGSFLNNIPILGADNNTQPEEQNVGLVFRNQSNQNVLVRTKDGVFALGSGANTQKIESIGKAVCMWCELGSPNMLQLDVSIETSGKVIEPNLLVDKTEKTTDYEVVFYNYGNQLIVDVNPIE